MARTRPPPPVRSLRSTAVAVLVSVVALCAIDVSPASSPPSSETRRRAAFPTAPPPGAAPDTSRVLREARQRQRAFERFRRRRLPWTWGRGGPPCDEHIGRFCLRLGGDDEDPWLPPPEPEEVREARRRLLAHLDSARRRAPASGWLADQRVRYLAETGRLEEALAEARRCGADAGHCAALRGFVRHLRGEFRGASRAFDLALRSMPEEAACRWTDLTVLYRDEPARGYGEGSCGERREAAARLWPLADPLWLVPGNDRRSEQLARRVRDRMQAGGAASPFGEPWGEDLREILLRYGWPVGFEQAHADVYDATAHRPAVAHYPHWGVRFMPPAGALGPDGWDLEGWELDPARPRSEYAPPYLREEVDRLEHQTARFRRRDSARVVSAWSWPGSEVPASRDGLFLYRGPDAPLVRGETVPAARRRCSAGAARTVAVAVAPAGPVVMGVESLVPVDSSAARDRWSTRLGTVPVAGIALSDLLLLAPAGDTIQAELERAAPCARPSGRLGAGARLGLYWEVYGAGGAPVVTELSVTPTGGGFLRDVGEFLGLAGERTPLVEIGWRERVPAAPTVHRRTLVVRIPPDAEAGSYELRLRVRGPSDGAPVEAIRRIEVVSGSSRRPAPASRPGPRSPGSAPPRRLSG